MKEQPDWSAILDDGVLNRLFEEEEETLQDHTDQTNHTGQKDHGDLHEEVPHNFPVRAQPSPPTDLNDSAQWSPQEEKEMEDEKRRWGAIKLNDTQRSLHPGASREDPGRSSRINVASSTEPFHAIRTPQLGRSMSDLSSVEARVVHPSAETTAPLVVDTSSTPAGITSSTPSDPSMPSNPRSNSNPWNVSPKTNADVPDMGPLPFESPSDLENPPALPGDLINDKSSLVITSTVVAIGSAFLLAFMVSLWVRRIKVQTKQETRSKQSASLARQMMHHHQKTTNNSRGSLQFLPRLSVISEVTCDADAVSIQMDSDVNSLRTYPPPLILNSHMMHLDEQSDSCLSTSVSDNGSRGDSMLVQMPPEVHSSDSESIARTGYTQQEMFFLSLQHDHRRSMLSQASTQRSSPMWTYGYASSRDTPLASDGTLSSAESLPGSLFDGLYTRRSFEGSVSEYTDIITETNGSCRSSVVGEL